MRARHALGIGVAVAPLLVLPFTAVAFFWGLAIALACCVVAAFLLGGGQFTASESKEPVDHPNLRTATGFPEKGPFMEGEDYD